MKRNRLWHQTLSIECIVLGDLENSPMFIFILFSKKVIYNTMKNDKKKHKQILTGIRKIFYSERFKAEIKGKRAIFDKKWNTLLNYLKNICMYTYNICILSILYIQTGFLYVFSHRTTTSISCSGIQDCMFILY